MESEHLIIHDFLYGKHKDRIDFPDSTLFIGTGFEIGGTHEDWGFGVYKKRGTEMILIGQGRGILEAINEAKKRLKCEHDYKDNGWCKLNCGTHKSFGL
jgi:hypothetical protein